MSLASTGAIATQSSDYNSQGGTYGAFNGNDGRSIDPWSGGAYGDLDATGCSTQAPDSWTVRFAAPAPVSLAYLVNRRDTACIGLPDCGYRMLNGGGALSFNFGNGSSTGLALNVTSVATVTTFNGAYNISMSSF